MAEEKKQDETVPGGKYILGENYIDAHGKVLGPVKEKKEKEVEAEKADTKK